MNKFTLFNKSTKTSVLTKFFLILLTLLSLGIPSAWGNSVSSANSSSDISGGKIVMKGNHATFTFGATDSHSISYAGGVTSAYKLGQLDHNTSRNFTFTWSANSGCTIKVTNISFDIRAYSSREEMKATFNGETKTINNILGSNKSFSASNLNGLPSGIVLTINNTCTGHKVLWNTSYDDDVEFYLENISITYTITPNKPTINGTTATINVSLNDENKLDMTTLIGVSDVTDFMPVAFGSNSYNDPQGVSTTGAYTLSGQYFYATKAGIYTFNNPYIDAKYNCHEESASTTGTITITVNRLDQTLTMTNGSVNVTTDKNNPNTLVLSTLCAQVGNGNVTYSLVSGPTSLSGEAAADNCNISGKNFYAWVGGTYTLRATASTTAQYNSTSSTFTVTVNRLTQTISWTPANLETEPFVEDDEVTATSNGNVTLAKSGAGVDYISIDGNKATVLEVGANAKVTLTATAAQTDVYNQVTDSKTISLTSLAKQHITFDQNLTKLKTTDGTKKVELKATSDSNRDSEIYYTCDANDEGIYVAKENGKWYLYYTDTAVKGIAVTAYLDGVDGSYVAASPVSQMVKVTNPNAKCDISETLSSAYGLKSTSKTYELTIPKKVVLNVRCSEKSLTLVQGYEIKFYKGNTQVGETQSFGITDGHYNNQDVKTRTFDNLDKDITKVVFTSNASKGYDITAASYERWSYANPYVSELNYEAYALSTVDDQTFTLNYANYQIELYIEGSSNFVLKSEDSFGDCETYGTKTVKVGYNVPAVKCEETAYLRIKDNTGTLLNTVTLHANVLGGLTQNITDHNIGTSYLTTDLVNLTAVSDRGLTNFSYSASPAGVAVFDGAQMTFSQSGTIAITVTEPGNATFNEATATVENVVVSKATPAINVDDLTGTAIPYRSTLSNSTLSGGSANITLRGVAGTPVAGSYTWSDPTHVVMDAAGEHSYGVTFNPTNTGMYNPNTTGSISINITRAEQTLAMKNGEVRVAVGGIDAGAADSKINLDNLIESQTSDVVENVKRDGNVTYAVISANAGKATIEGSTFSATEIGEYIIRATKAATDYYNVVTADFTVTVTKRENTLTTKPSYSQYVDDAIVNVATIVNSDGDIHTSSSDATIAYYDVAQNKIVIPNKDAKSFDQTTVTIKIWQDATTRFEACGEKTITLTVKKYDNPFACSWGSFTKTVNFDKVTPVQLTTQNSDYTHFPITISQTDGQKIAKLEPNDDTNNTITAFYSVGQATWHLSQSENYKYKAASGDVTLSVQTLNNEACYIFEDYSEHEFSTGITDGSGHYDTPIPVSGPVDKLYFSARKSLAGVNKFIVQYSVDNGSNWRTIAQPQLNLVTWDNYGPYDFPNLANDERVTHIRFGAETGATFSKYYKNIQITRATNIIPLDENNNPLPTSPTGLVMPTSTVDGSTTAKFYLNYSTCDEVIKIVSDNAHFTVDQSEIIVDPTKDFNRAEITVTYSSTTKGTHTGTITVYTKYQNETFKVTGKTDKKHQSLTWEEDFAANPLSLQVGLVVDNVKYAATVSSGNAVYYESSDESVIMITDGGLGFEIVGEGTATLRAYDNGDDDWFSIEDTKTINATYKKIQEIVWTQDFIRNMEVGMEKTLEAKVYIRNLKTGELTYNAARTNLITYSCPANSVISLDNENKKITLIGYGQTSITASMPTGDENFEDAHPVTLIVKVRKPSDGCETPWVLDQSSTVELYLDKISGGAFNFSDWTTPELTSEPIMIDPANGKPDKLSYQHDAEIYTVRDGGLLRMCTGEVIAQQRVNGTWYDIDGSYYKQEATLANWAAGAYDWREVTDLQIDENADAIRFKRYSGGTGHHNFKDIQISLKHYLRPTVETVELGDITIGEDRPIKIGIEYSNIQKDLKTDEGNPDDMVVIESNVHIDCGTFGHYDVLATIHPTELGPWSNSIIVTDKATNEEITIVINANVLPEFMHTYETAGQWGENTHWKDGKKPTYKDEVRIEADVEVVSDITVKGITIENGATITVNPGVTLTLTGGTTRPRTKYGDLHVKDGGKVVVGTGVFMINDFILDAALGNTETSASSGQILDENEVKKFIVKGDAYFQMTLNPSGENTLGWYDFVVPFNVDVTSGISIVDNAGNVLPARHGEDYQIMRYSEAKRAERGKDWIKFNGTMQAGRVYTIAVDAEHPEWNTVLFKKNKGAALGAPATYEAECSAGEAIDCGWNGLGNGTLQHMKLSDASAKIQVYDHTSNVFETRDDISGIKFAVGTSFFLQVDVDKKPISFVTAEAALPFLAPARERRTTDEFRLALTAENADSPSDRLWVSASEEATGEYVVGHDLLKMGTPSEAKVAQMWAKNEANRLCDIEMPMTTGKAKCELGLFAPQEANYTLSVEKMPDDAMLYLTYNGRPIWNLTYAPYTFDLTQGFTDGYGLQISVKDAPQVTTGVDDVQDGDIRNTKVIIDNKMFVITPQGAMYDATGKKIQ